MNSSLNFPLAHGLARLGLGINLALHGYTRLPDLSGFASALQEQFAETFLPAPLIAASAYGIAIGEAVIGTLLILGLFLRPTLVAGTLLMILLLFGTCLIQNWQSAGLQMTYLAFYTALLATVGYDKLSIDHWRRSTKKATP